MDHQRSRAEFDMATEAGGVVGPSVKELQQEVQALRDILTNQNEQLVEMRRERQAADAQVAQRRILAMVEGQLMTLEANAKENTNGSAVLQILQGLVAVFTFHLDEDRRQGNLTF
jgi:hypothetical protein